ncbi:glycosyltransferase family 2 protein [Pedobacter frigiditerrae]|uniref:glycosyltransferase family 2 protein n=1 Tax=Pedobacter frigiditerrae TaxID=2530452 RepID=UPI00292CD84E|nr:glycosyltransferase [Pedobacter frigiditerrae]
MMKPLVSVIVPVYNAETFLSRCVDSILSQSLTDFELLLINDGSQDNSGQICEQYSKRDNRVKVFHQENKGVSFTRNVGVKQASGIYSIQIDADDYVDENMLYDMYNQAKSCNADIVIAGYYIENGSSSVFKTQETKNDKFSCMQRLLEGRLHGASWNKLILHSIYIDNNIEFPEGVTFCEDLVTMLQIVNSATTISCLPNGYVHYVQHSTSAIAVRGENSFNSLFYVLKIIIEKFGAIASLTKSIQHFKVFVLGEMFLYGSYGRYEYAEKFKNEKLPIYSNPFLSWPTKIYIWCLVNQYFKLFDVLELLKKYKRQKKYNNDVT